MATSSKPASRRNNFHIQSDSRKSIISLRKNTFNASTGKTKIKVQNIFLTIFIDFVGWCVLHLRSTIERVALIKNHRNDKNRLLDALAAMLQARTSTDRLQQIDSSYSDDVIKTVVKLIQMVLMELSKHISSFPNNYKNIKVLDVKNLILRCMKMDKNIQTINVIMSDIDDLIS